MSERVSELLRETETETDSYCSSATDTYLCPTWQRRPLAVKLRCSPDRDVDPRK